MMNRWERYFEGDYGKLYSLMHWCKYGREPISIEDVVSVTFNELGDPVKVEYLDIVKEGNTHSLRTVLWEEDEW